MAGAAAQRAPAAPAAWAAQRQQHQHQQARWLTDEAKEAIERTLVVDTLATVSSRRIRTTPNAADAADDASSRPPFAPAQNHNRPSSSSRSASTAAPPRP